MPCQCYPEISIRVVQKKIGRTDHARISVHCGVMKHVHHVDAEIITLQNQVSRPSGSGYQEISITLLAAINGPGNLPPASTALEDVSSIHRVQ